MSCVPKKDAPNASLEQRRLMQQFNDHSGFEFMGMDEVRADDPEHFVFQYRYNVQWLKDVADECFNFLNEYTLKNYDNINDFGYINGMKGPRHGS